MSSRASTRTRSSTAFANNFPGPTDYIVQGGSVSGTGTGNVNQPGFPFTDEFVQQLAFTDTGVTNPSGVAGQLAMANAGPDTNSSQFFVTTGAPYFLDFKHTIFAQLVSGFDTVKLMTQVAKGGTDGTTPVSPITINSASLSDTSPDGVVHIDTTHATIGQTAKVTVTATDAVNNTKATQTFTVNVTGSLNPTQPEKPFLGPVSNQVVGVAQTTPTVQGQSAIFKLNAVSPTPNDPLTFTVQGGTTTSSGQIAFTPVQNATASVNAQGIVSVIPKAGFTGVINLLVGVRDATNRAGTTSIDSPSNFDTQAITLTVNNGAVVNLAPIAITGTSSAVANTPSPIQLTGITSNPDTPSQTLTYALTGNPQHGTISNFNAAAGTFTYTPDRDFQGNDSVSFRVRDVGAPTPNLDSGDAVQNIVVGGGVTNAVRVIGNVLVVTPPPRTDGQPNTIALTLVGSNVQVRVNGLIDQNQPAESSLDRIVVYGSKADDKISISPAITVPATLDGGHGGKNTVQAGGADSLLHGWFGQNTLAGGAGDDTLIGRSGRVRFVRSPGTDIYFKAVPHKPTTLHGPGKKPGGQYYRFVGNRLIPVPGPYFPQKPTRIK